MKIKMLSTKQASTDGVNIRTFKQDEIYDLPEGLAGDLILVNWAVSAEDPAPDPEKKPDLDPEEGSGEKSKKDSGAAPENKSKNK